MQRRFTPRAPRLARRLLSLPALAVLAASGAAGAARAADASTISQVLLYPGGAQVDRTLTVAAGATQLRLACLPASLERESVQLQAPAHIALGELQIETVPRAQLPECRPVDPRVRELEAQRNLLEAEQGGVELSLGYLKGLSDTGAKGGPALAATLDSLRRNAQDLLTRQQALKLKMAEVEAQLGAAKAELAQPEGGQVSVLRVRLSAPQAGELQLRYRVPDSGWTPQYRARLDTAAGTLQLDRVAQIAQNSGEDWTQVRLRLSTAQPRQRVASIGLAPWTLALLPPVQAEARTAFPIAAAPAAPPRAPAPMLERIAVSGSAVRFDASVFEGDFATEYELPQRVSLRGNGQGTTVSLGSQTVGAKQLSRVQPQIEAAAYLLAEIARPDGAWPRGPVQLFRDGTLVGESMLSLGSGKTLSLPFGRDERLRVRVDPEKREGADAGFIGARREQQLTRQWLVENLGKRPVTLQVLEAAPVSQHEDIRVETRFTPPVSEANWREQPGIQLWELPLAPGAAQTFQAVYRISVPKDARVSGMR
ncbi:DUF4139 domain-containing protein [Roseateles chitinivorans]|nr:DUF4139 domain-containing protein [Roseateles chitinivorans]